MDLARKLKKVVWRVLERDRREINGDCDKLRIKESVLKKIQRHNFRDILGDFNSKDFRRWCGGTVATMAGKQLTSFGICIKF